MQPVQPSITITSPVMGVQSPASTGMSTPVASTMCSQAGADSDPREAIRSVDAALQVLPLTPAMDAARAELLRQKEHLKKRIIQSRPLGSQLDSCRAALDRAIKRRSDCVAAVEAAQMRMRRADEDVAGKRAELAELEAAVAVESGTKQPSSLTQLTVALSRVMAELKASPVVPQSITESAEVQMTKLMSDLLLVAQQATAVTSPQDAAVQLPASAMAVAPSALLQSGVLEDGSDIDVDLAETPQAPVAQAASAEGVRRRARAKTFDPACQMPCLPSPGFHVVTGAATGK